MRDRDSALNTFYKVTTEDESDGIKQVCYTSLYHLPAFIDVLHFHDITILSIELVASEQERKEVERAARVVFKDRNSFSLDIENFENNRLGGK